MGGCEKECGVRVGDQGKEWKIGKEKKRKDDPKEGEKIREKQQLIIFFPFSLTISSIHSPGHVV